MSDALTFKATYSQEALPANQSRYMLYVLLEITPVEPTEPAPRLPVNLGIVLDKSDSMLVPILSPEQFHAMSAQGAVREVIVDGVPVWQFDNVPDNFKINAPCSLDYVKQALRVAVDKLGSQDRFALAAFAHQAQVLIPSQPGANKRALLKAVDQMDQLHLGSDTYMAAGLEAGYAEVRRSYVREMVNRLFILTDGFAQDAAQCQMLAQAAAHEGISISTVGLGVEFNEELLISLADLSGGNAYFIREAHEITEAFEQELTGAQRIALHDVNLKMRTSEGVELHRVHRVHPIISDLGRPTVTNRSANLALGDLPRKEKMGVLLEVLVPPHSEGAYRLAQIVLDYSRPNSGTYRDKTQHDLVIRYGAQGVSEINPQLARLIEKVNAFKLQTRALEEARTGNVAVATQKLRAAATRLISLGETELARAAMQEASNLEMNGQMSAAGTKRLRYDTRRLTQKVT